MKSFFSIFVTAMVFILSNAINLQGQSIIVSIPENNFLFKGIENPMEFYAPFKIKEIKVIGGRINIGNEFQDSILSDKGVSEKYWRNVQKEGRFLLIPDCDANRVEVIFVGKKGSMSKYFYTLQVPNPIVRFSGVTALSNTVSSGVKSACLVEAYNSEDFVYAGLMYSIKEFKIQITHEGKTEEFVCEGSMLMAKARGSLAKLQVGDRIVIYDVNVTGACGLIHLEDRLDLLVQ